MTETIYKSETKYKIDWYKVKQKDSGINTVLQMSKGENTDLRLIKRWHPIKGQYWGLSSTENLEKLISTNKYLYEILEPNIPKKVYFDIDSKVANLEACKRVVLAAFPNANLQISGYESEAKCSYHIILNNFVINTEQELMSIKEFAKTNCDLGFDTSVYGKYNVFKCINQSKPKKDSLIQAYMEGSHISTFKTSHLPGLR